MLERVENVESVIIDEAVGTTRHRLGVAKESLHIAHGCAAANERADASRVKFIELRVRDIGWRGNQSAGLIEPKRKDVRAVAMPERIARVADNVVAGARTERNVV